MVARLNTSAIPPDAMPARRPKASLANRPVAIRAARAIEAVDEYLAEHSIRHDPVTGKLRLHYDPRLAEPFKDGFSEAVDLWPVWDQIRCPVLVLRGVESDLLTAEQLLDDPVTGGDLSGLVRIAQLDDVDRIGQLAGVEAALDGVVVRLRHRLEGRP